MEFQSLDRGGATEIGNGVTSAAAWEMLGSFVSGNVETSPSTSCSKSQRYFAYFIPVT